MDEVAGTPSSGSKRQRSRQACESCRLRKRKCDGADPCSQCVDFEYSCHYTDKHSTAPPAKARKVEHASARSESLNALSPPGLLNAGSNYAIRESTFVPFADQPGFADPVRAKFAPSESYVAFPRLLGAELSADRAPRLHCFGWNTGTRAEIPQPHVDVTQFLTLAEAKKLSNVYFEVVHPEIGFLDQSVYKQKIELRWVGRLEPKEYDGIIAGVTALGSFFMGENGHPNEPQLVHLLGEVLHISCGIYFPIINHNAAWILRTIYLRLTTRPNASWTASCAMAHALESTGVYKDHGSAPFSNDVLLNASEIEYRRRLFWIAWSLHGILSKEYGRTKIQLEITTNMPKLDHNVSAPLLSIAQCLEISEGTGSHGDKISMLMTMLERLCDLRVITDFQQLLRTDMIFAVYRRLRLIQYKITKPYEELILAAGSASMQAAKRLADLKRPWWNVVSCPFQFVCICLAIDSAESCALLRGAIQTLDHLVRSFDTFMVREALQVANNLVKLARDRKVDDLRNIEASITQSEDSLPADIDPNMGQIAGLDDPLFWTGWMNDTFAWDLVMPSEKGMNGFNTQRPFIT